MKALFITLIFLPAYGFCQTAIFENEDFRLELTVDGSIDSLAINFALLNKTNRSFYFERRVPASVNWSKGGNLSIVQLGTDLKSFNEFEFPVTQVKPNTTFKTKVSSKYLRDNLNLKLKISFYKAEESKLSDLLNTAIRDKSGSWVWSEYYFPFSLSRK